MSRAHPARRSGSQHPTSSASSSWSGDVPQRALDAVRLTLTLGAGVAFTGAAAGSGPDPSGSALWLLALAWGVAAAVAAGLYPFQARSPSGFRAGVASGVDVTLVTLAVVSAAFVAERAALAAPIAGAYALVVALSAAHRNARVVAVATCFAGAQLASLALWAAAAPLLTGAWAVVAEALTLAPALASAPSSLLLIGATGAAAAGLLVPAVQFESEPLVREAGNGLLSRAYLEERLREEIARGEALDKPFSLTLLEVVTPLPEEDATLRAIADELGWVHTATEVVAHYERTVFAVLQTVEIEDPIEHADGWLHRVVDADWGTPGQESLRVDAHASVVVWPEDGPTLPALLREAERRLARARDLGAQQVAGPAHGHRRGFVVLQGGRRP
ncbi:MAG: hypothetical protein MJE66_08245 [Proteobacteria bacterium]|nr:hypothetical protein [Pseudomonadota bacterium]